MITGKAEERLLARTEKREAQGMEAKERKAEEMQTEIETQTGRRQTGGRLKEKRHG